MLHQLSTRTNSLLMIDLSQKPDHDLCVKKPSSTNGNSFFERKRKVIEAHGNGIACLVQEDVQ